MEEPSADQWNAISYNGVVSHVASTTTPGFVVTVDYIHVSDTLILVLGVDPC